MARPKFDRNSTGTQVAETFRDQIRGKTILLTGPAPGSIGEATALAIARQAPALLILASRTSAKLDAVAASCREVFTGASNGAAGTREEPGLGSKSSGTGMEVKTVVVDLSSQISVRSAAKEIVGLADRIDILINNAGLGLLTRQLSPEGIECTFATNHLGPFLLTTLLLPLLRPGSRIVNVSSSGHRISPVRFSDINFDNEVDGPKKGKIDIPTSEQPHPKNPKWCLTRGPDGFPSAVAYGMSKTANILFTVELKRRLADRGIEIFALHPGEIRTNIVISASPEFEAESKTRQWKSTDQGCATTLIAALDPEISGPNHLYLEDCQIARAARWASDPDKAEQLWRLSENLVAGTSAPMGSKL